LRSALDRPNVVFRSSAVARRRHPRRPALARTLLTAVGLPAAPAEDRAGVRTLGRRDEARLRWRRLITLRSAAPDDDELVRAAWCGGRRYSGRTVRQVEPMRARERLVLTVAISACWA